MIYLLSGQMDEILGQWNGAWKQKENEFETNFNENYLKKLSNHWNENNTKKRKNK